MSPEERKRKEEEEERERARFVRPTMVPMPPQPQPPQIQQQPQQPGVLQQFGQAFATAGIDKGVDMAIKAIPFFINKGAKVPGVTYANEGKTAPSVTTVWNQYNRKGMTPAQFNVPAYNQQVSPSKESYWQKAERTGLFGVPGTQNVYVDPGKGTVAYQREDVKPFTWMWNKGRNFLGYGAPLAERSE